MKRIFSKCSSLHKNFKNYLFLFAEFGGSIDVQAITNFVDNGGNVLVAGSSNVGKYQYDSFELDYSQVRWVSNLLYYLKFKIFIVWL